MQRVHTHRNGCPTLRSRILQVLVAARDLRLNYLLSGSDSKFQLAILPIKVEDRSSI